MFLCGLRRTIAIQLPERERFRKLRTPVRKQQARALAGPSGVVGDSARGKISRGASEAGGVAEGANVKGKT